MSVTTPPSSATLPRFRIETSATDAETELTPKISMDGWSTLVLLLMLALATWIDLRTHRIPNAIVIPGILIAFTLYGLAEGPRGLGAALGGMLLAGGLLLPFHLGGGMGAGDVKLMAMVGAFLGPSGALLAAMSTLVAGLLLSGLALLGTQAMQSGSGPRPLSSTSTRAPASATEQGRALTLRFPYAMAILLGTLASLWLFADLKPAGELVATLWTR